MQNWKMLPWARTHTKRMQSKQISQIFPGKPSYHFLLGFGGLVIKSRFDPSKTCEEEWGKFNGIRSQKTSESKGSFLANFTGKASINLSHFTSLRTKVHFLDDTSFSFWMKYNFETWFLDFMTLIFGETALVAFGLRPKNPAQIRHGPKLVF